MRYNSRPVSAVEITNRLLLCVEIEGILTSEYQPASSMCFALLPINLSLVCFLSSKKNITMRS